MVVDIAICVILIVTIVIGWRRGLVLSLITTLSLVIAAVAGYLLISPVSLLINKTPLPDMISTSVYDGTSAACDTVLNTKGALTKDGLLNELHIPEAISNKIFTNSDDFSGKENICNTVASKVTDFTVKAIAFTGVFILVLILLAIIKGIWRKIREDRVPVIHQIDTVGGICFGIFSGVLFISFIMFIVTYAASLGLLTEAVTYIKNSTIGSFLYENNLFGALIAHIFF